MKAYIGIDNGVSGTIGIMDVGSKTLYSFTLTDKIISLLEVGIRI